MLRRARARLVRLTPREAAREQLDGRALLVDIRSEMILTMEMEGTDKESGNKGGMVMTADMWLAPKSAGYNEIADFYKRMGQKLDWAPGGMGMMGGRPDMAKGMAELYKEGAKLNGMPVFQVVKMGVHAEGQPQNGQAAQAPPQQQEQQADKPSIGSLLGGRFGGFGKKKKHRDKPAHAGQSQSVTPWSTKGAPGKKAKKHRG